MPAESYAAATMIPLLIAAIVAGLLLLTYAADQFVLGAARVAVSLRLSAVVIGAVVIGFGTSAPEMVVSGLAAGGGSLDIAVGNIIGSNVANLSLVLGTASMVAPIVVGSSTIRREAPLSLGAVLVFAGLVQGGLTRWEGLVLSLLLAASLAYIIVAARSEQDDQLTGEVEEYLDGYDGQATSPDGLRPGREWLRTGLGLLGTLVAAQVLVESATRLAATYGLKEGFVGITIVAIGTSLPELATSLQAVRKDETDLIVGNLLGSNLFNSLAVGAVAAFAGPGMVNDPDLTGVGVLLMVGIAVGASLAMVIGRRVVRWEGATLLVVYMATLPLLA